MHIEDLRTWHWVIIGLLVGLMFGVVKRSAGPWFDNDSINVLESGDLEMLVNNQPLRGPLRHLVVQFHAHQPLVKDLVVHPPVPGEPSHSNWVTGKAYQIVVQPSNASNPQSQPAYYEQWQPFTCRTSVPYKAFDGAPGKYPNIAAYLAAIAKKPNPNLTFKYAWWEAPALTLLMPTAAGLLIIGIAWPMMITLMQGAGVARPRRAKLPKRSKTADKTTTTKDTSAGDRQLAAMNDQLEASLAAVATSHAIGAQDVDAPTPIKPLNNDAEPVTVPASAGIDDPKEYGGEFYPVAKPKHHD